jgi:hypothetical protein
VALNFTDERVRVTLDVPLPRRQWVARVSTRRPDVGWSVYLGRAIELGPYEATLFTAERQEAGGTNSSVNTQSGETVTDGRPV